jgi:hypothetical protein
MCFCNLIYEKYDDNPTIKCYLCRLKNNNYVD